MNVVGKSFVVCILALSLIFLGASVMIFATHKDWPAIINRTAQQAKPGEPIGLKHQLAEAKEKVETLNAQRNRLTAEVAGEETARRVALGELEVERTALNNEYDGLLKQETSVKEQTRAAQDENTQAQEMLKVKLEEIAKLEEEIAKAREDRNQQFNDSLELEDQLHQRLNELKRAQDYTGRLSP